MYMYNAVITSKSNRLQKYMPYTRCGKNLEMFVLLLLNLLSFNFIFFFNTYCCLNVFNQHAA